MPRGPGCRPRHDTCATPAPSAGTMSLLAPSSRLVGNRINRKEDPRLLTGRGCYVDDVVVPGVAHVAFARSDVARGRIRGIDVGAARRSAGVVAVVAAP